MKLSIGDKVSSDKPGFHQYGPGIVDAITDDKFYVKYSRRIRTFYLKDLKHFRKAKITDIARGDKNVIFKLNYNDREYQEHCSKKIIIYNKQLEKANWCAVAHCRNKYPCNESCIFSYYVVSAGAKIYKKGKLLPKSQWVGKTIKNTMVGKYVLFTTRKPQTSEKERYIFGFYKIKKNSSTKIK